MKYNIIILDKITKYIPIITGILLFIGYLNYYSYYEYFNINISTYLTTGELILSFLPLTIPILGVIGYISMMAVSTIMRTTHNKEQDDKDDDTSKIFLIYETKKYYKGMDRLWENKEYKNIKGIIKILFYFAVMLVSFFLTVLFIIFPIFLFVYLTAEKWNEIPPILFYIISPIWFVGFITMLNKNDNHLYKGKGYVETSSLIMLFIACLWITNRHKAYNILNGNSKVTVSFLYKDNPIKTDSNKVYIGKTNNYIFLRNLKENMNEIYFLNDVNKIEVTHLKDKDIAKN